jgi:hypothetical protein
MAISAVVIHMNEVLTSDQLPDLGNVQAPDLQSADKAAASHVNELAIESPVEPTDEV